MNALDFRSATDLSLALRSKAVGCRELLEFHLARVGALNPGLDAVVKLGPEQTRRTAPIGMTPAGPPVGIQVVGPCLGDHTAIVFAGPPPELMGGWSGPPACRKEEP